MQIFDNLNIDFLGKRKYFYMLSGVLFILGMLSLLFRGLELGIDFKGGSEIALKFEKPIQISDIRDDLSQIGLGKIEIKTFGGETGVLIRTDLQAIPEQIFPKVISTVESSIEEYYPGVAKNKIETTESSITYQFETDSVATDLSAKLFEAGLQSMAFEGNKMLVRVGIADWIEEVLRDKMPDNPFVIQKETKVGPKIGSELKRDSIIAVLLSLLVILIYLGFRFKFVFAVGAVAALFHDVFITLGLFSLLYGIIPGLNLEVSITIVAAFLTLVGYSINDTVIVFDRVRENFKIHKTADLETNMNNAINKTFRRTIITSATTLFVVIVLLVFGGEVLRGFAFALFFGIIFGTYSSIFVASAFVLEYAQRSKKRIEF
ncbi:MAG: protein translocase subunit SecF [Ignavibacteriae bacterium HGW-Ignavibacteriae-2]|jgi:preprotein translocase SecF subunit|nr:protein translocase subunit SecF [Bacteroidota bacterium]PKL89807.1 MAG: protein translocase subunit SecF [Ignavibacteriae bacterium HGW-Ignavibacteriae-2]